MVNYSVLKFFTGLVNATFNACMLIVKKAISNATQRPMNKNVEQGTIRARSGGSDNEIVDVTVISNS